MTVKNDRRAEFEEEHRLLQRSRDGDLTAYGQLFEKYWDGSVRYARRFVRSGGDPEDLAQEAFTKVMETIGRGKGPTVAMGHYVRTTIRTIAAGRMRSKSAHEVPTDSEVLVAAFEANAFHDDQDMSDWLIEGFNRLTGRQQSVVWEHIVERRSLREIAPELGVSSATAMRAYHGAMKTLRSEFAYATAAASRDPQCLRVVSALIDDNREDEELSRHLSGCQRCQGARRRIASRDRQLLSVIVVAGLGELGVAASQVSVGSALTSWLTALTVPAQAIVVAAPIAALVLGGLAIVHAGTTTANEAAPGSSLGVVLGQGVSSGPALATLGSCEVIREPVSQGREIWRLAGGSECDMRVVRTDDHVTLLDTAVTTDRFAVEVAHAGDYAITVQTGTGHAATSQTVAVSVR